MDNYKLPILFDAHCAIPCILILNLWLGIVRCINQNHVLTWKNEPVYFIAIVLL